MKKFHSYLQDTTEMLGKVIDFLEELEGENKEDYEIEELHDNVFNSELEFIYDHEAIDELNNYGTWEAINTVKHYQQDNYGEIVTDLSNPCDVANYLYYIESEQLISELLETFYSEGNESPNVNEIISRAKLMKHEIEESMKY